MTTIGPRVQSIMDQRRKEALTHDIVRWESISSFVLSVYSLAVCMRQNIDNCRDSSDLDPSSKERLGYIEQQIRGEFRNQFGHDMIQPPDAQEQP
jgi:hypothetical protein